MTTAETTADTTSTTPLGLIDSDVHVHTPRGLADVYDYMPEAWRRRFTSKNAEASHLILPPRYAYPLGDVLRKDAESEPGVIAASDPEFVKHDLLDRCGTSHAILSSLLPASMAAGLASPDELPRKGS